MNNDTHTLADMRMLINAYERNRTRRKNVDYRTRKSKEVTVAISRQWVVSSLLRVLSW